LHLAIQMRRRPLHGQHAAADEGQIGAAPVGCRTRRRCGHLADQARHLHAHPPQDVWLFPHNTGKFSVRSDGVVVALTGAWQPAGAWKVSTAVGAVRADLGMPCAGRLPVLRLQVRTGLSLQSRIFYEFFIRPGLTKSPSIDTLGATGTTTLPWTWRWRWHSILMTQNIRMWAKSRSSARPMSPKRESQRRPQQISQTWLILEF